MKRNWVIKIGSSLVTKGNTGLDNKNIKNWTKQINELVKNNIKVIIVSSGAIAEGMNRLGLKKRPTSSSELQALASIGQMGLIQAYETAFKKYNILNDPIYKNYKYFKLIEERNSTIIYSLKEMWLEICDYMNTKKPLKS